MCVCLCPLEWLFECVDVCVCICMYVCMHVYVCIGPVAVKRLPVYTVGLSSAEVSGYQSHRDWHGLLTTARCRTSGLVFQLANTTATGHTVKEEEEEEQEEEKRAVGNSTAT